MVGRDPPITSLPTPSMPVWVYNHVTLKLSDPFVTGFTESIWAFPVELLPNKPVQGRFNTVLVRRNWISDDYPVMDGIHSTAICTIDLVFYLSLI